MNIYSKALCITEAPKLADYCVASADPSSYWAFKVQDHPRVLGEETRKIPAILDQGTWVKISRELYKWFVQTQTFQTWFAYLSTPSILLRKRVTKGQGFMIAWQGQKRLDFVYSKRIPLDSLTTKVVPKKSMVVYQLRWSDWAGFTGKSFHASVLDPRALWSIL